MITEAPTEERIGKYRVHPIASMFPLLKDEEYKKFRDDISIHGQIEPIIVQGDLLLDGRNRLRACLDLNREPKVEEFEDADYGAILRCIVSKNIYRRHLTVDQQVMIIAEASSW